MTTLHLLQSRIKTIGSLPTEMKLGAPLRQIFQDTDYFKMSYIMYNVIFVVINVRYSSNKTFHD